MIRNRVSLAVVGAITACSALTLGLAGPGSAAVGNANDPSFTPVAGDLVGVGSDTTQFALTYLTDGHNGVAGFNAGKTTGRIASFAADGTPSTIVLREGSSAVTRPNGSGAGKKSLYAPANLPDVNFARSSSGLNATEISAGLQESAFAVDGLKLAVKTDGSNAPDSIPVADAVKIYDGTFTNWSEVTGNHGAGVIKALIPQSGSGTRSFFEAQLKAANGGVAVNIVATETQEHSDTDIKNDVNAVAPFSTGRAKSLTTVKTLGGLNFKRALYNVVRTADLAGASSDDLNDAFGEEGFVCSPEAKPLIEAAGFDQLASTARGGNCGEFTQIDVTNFKTSAEAADPTTTTLAGAASNGQNVNLTAAVDSGANGPVGSVVFNEGATEVGTVAVAGEQAVLDLADVEVGQHDYTASFVPSDDTAFQPSDSESASVDVLETSSVGVSVSPATSTFGKSHVATISVEAAGDPAAGSVSVKLGSDAAKNVTLVNGIGTFTVPATTKVGTKAVLATYEGSASTFGSNGTANVKTTKASTTNTLSLSARTIKASKHAKATVSIRITGAASTVKATGKVTIKAGKKTIGTGTVKNGKVTVTLAKLKKGTYSVKATFAGTSDFGGSSSKTIKLKVTN